MAIDPLEFDFNAGKFSKPANGSARKPSSPLDEDPTAVVFKGPDRPKKFSNPKKESHMHTATAPTPIDARKNIERQKREQRAVSTLLGGAATGLLLLIILIASLAGLGGYVLWKQINEQSVTISMLEANLRQEIIVARDDLEKANQQLSKKLVNLQARTDEQQATVKKLSSVVESERNKNKRQDLQLNQIEKNTGSVASRVNKLERHISKER